MDTNLKQSRTQEDTSKVSDSYQKGLDLAEAGEYDQALVCVQQHINSTPDDAEALNDAGAIFHCMGRSDEAIDHFTKARVLQPESTEITWNLSEVYLATDKPKQAEELFDDMERLGILSADVLNRTADVFLKQDNPQDALRMLLRSQKTWPGQEILEPMIEVIRSKIDE